MDKVTGNIREFPNINEIKEQAADWVVKMHGLTYKTGQAIPAEQAQQLRVWLAQSDLHRDYFLKMLSSWDAMAILEELADILPLSDMPGNQLGSLHSPQSAAVKKSVGFRGWLFPGAVAASFAAIVLMVVSIVVTTPAQQLHYSTGIGEQASYTLDDGSRITLNTHSELTVDYNGSKRVVTLQRGEVNFDVAKDKQRPFVVYAGQGMVWAVGTAFNVFYREGYVDVIVSEGTVKVFSDISSAPEAAALAATDRPLSLTVDRSPSSENGAATEVLLDAGESAQYKKVIVENRQLEKQNLKRKLAWQTGALIFEGETLEQAIKEISHYTDQQLVIIDASISQTRVGGRFKTDDIDQLIDSLARGLNVKTEKVSGNKILFSAN